MLEKLIQFDKEFFVFLNGLGSESFDGLWLILTTQYWWAPYFLLIFYLLHKKVGWGKFWFYLLFVTMLILVCDQLANVIKNYIHRIRPCNAEELKHSIRIIKSSPTFSFFSSHAGNSMATTLFTYLILRRHYRYTYLLFLFPLIFGYSRIYLGMHYPSDILAGYVYGAIFGFGAYKLYQKLILRPE
jgi:undecaprenyl-diphosphatase